MKSKLSLLLALCCALLLVASPTFAGLDDDDIKSEHIREADGTSGQDTNEGSGIKTGHIQDGAVTDAKISGVISASKIETGYFQKKYSNRIVVAKSGGDFSDPVQAYYSISDSSPTNRYLIKIMPGVYDIGQISMYKDYVDIEGSGVGVTVLRKSTTSMGWLGAVEMSGIAEIRELTVETISVGGAAVGIIVNSPGNSQKIKNVHIFASNRDATNGTCGIYVRNKLDLLLDNITIDVEEFGETSNQYVVVSGLQVFGEDTGFIRASNVKINTKAQNVKDYGVYVTSGSGGVEANANIKLVNVESKSSGAIESYGVYVSRSFYSTMTFDVFQGRFQGNTGSILHAGYSDFPVRMAGTQLIGEVLSSGNPPPIKLVNCFDGDFNPILQ